MGEIIGNVGAFILEYWDVALAGVGLFALIATKTCDWPVLISAMTGRKSCQQLYSIRYNQVSMVSISRNFEAFLIAL